MSIDLSMDPAKAQVEEAMGAILATPPLNLSPFLADATNWGADPAGLGAEVIRDVVSAALAVQPRSLQKEIGPSEIGVPCPRRLGYKFARVPPTGLAPIKWAAAVGTAVHREFTDWCHAYNERHGVARFLPDLRVYVGDLYAEFGGGRPIFGTLDALDVATGTVLDVKVPGTTQMKKHAGSNPENPVYDMQVDLYGNGCRNAGFPIKSVGILRLPRAGTDLSQAGWKARAHDPANGEAGLKRVGRLAKMVEAGGADVLPLLPAVEHYCSGCDWFDPRSTDLRTGCPGAMPASSSAPAGPPRAMTELIG